MLLLLFAPQPAAPAQELVNFSSLLIDSYPALNASGANDLVWWTNDELFRWIDEAAQRLARNCGVFVSRDTSITTATGASGYNLPSAHVSTIQVDVAGFVLRARTIQDLECLDYNWPTTQGAPNAFVQNSQGLNIVVLYPQPDSNNGGKTVGVIEHTSPPQITASAATLAAPQVVQEYFKFYMLGEARAAQTKAQMPDVAQWFRQQAMWMESIIEQLWGEAQ